MRGGGGRKKFKQGALQGELNLQDTHSITRVLSQRGSNIFEVEDSNSVRIMCLLPAKFNKSLWIRKGSFVVVEEIEREKALDAGSKVTGIICNVLFEEQIRTLKRSSAWPANFDSEVMEASEMPKGSFCEELGDDGSGDEGLAPLEANENRRAAVQCELSESSDEDDP